ncbi:Mitogen-activated protein kinase kinase kinase 3 [Durusdinium trenchii]|uniref:Mitogen-activated protein kinase kinase kinase 3 n=1 Tax=Durusdinium trenchii TaxID=1381693 RepID=A0ABP0SEJ5_9DINO
MGQRGTQAGAADPYNTMRILAVSWLDTEESDGNLRRRPTFGTRRPSTREIYRTARQHWPITEGLACAGMTTILRIDALKELTAQEIFENQSQGRLQYVIVRNGGKDGQVKSYPPASGKPQELEGSVPLEIEGLKEAVWRHSPYSWGSIPGSFYKAASMKTKSLPGYATAFSKPFMAFVK